MRRFGTPFPPLPLNPLPDCFLMVPVGINPVKSQASCSATRARPRLMSAYVPLNERPQGGHARLLELTLEGGPRASPSAPPSDYRTPPLAHSGQKIAIRFRFKPMRGLCVTLEPQRALR